MNIYNCKGGTRSPRMRVRLGPLLESTRLRRALLASSSEISIHLARCLAEAKMGLQNTGGLVEWLMAPVLKTGRAQALVGSNPTPSAAQFSIFDCPSRSARVDKHTRRLTETPYKLRADKHTKASHRDALQL